MRYARAAGSVPPDQRPLLVWVVAAALLLAVRGLVVILLRVRPTAVSVAIPVQGRVLVLWRPAAGAVALIGAVPGRVAAVTAARAVLVAVLVTDVALVVGRRSNVSVL